ncbi:MAG TPA: helix-turn-helix domain-containing protein [Conexibacter sp.]|nr:helix-turn-helix domain-containing protein [Conexibacter sp.]
MASPLLIRAARRDAKLTQAELADRLGTTQPVIARLERLDSNPTLATLERALEAAGYLLELRAVPKRQSDVDESQILERLRWTPAQRLAVFTASNRNVNALVRAAQRSSDARR